MRNISALFTIFAVLGGFAFFATVNADTITVTNRNDSGSGSLREAIADANSGDVINFSVVGTIILSSGELDIKKDLAIEGPGPEHLAISGGNTSRVINIYSWDVPGGVFLTISGVTIRDGYSESEGGGILVWSSDIEPSTLELNNVTITNNNSGQYFGGGIANLSANTTITNSRITENTTGGIFNAYGTLIIANSRISGNVGHRGGGIHQQNGGTLMVRSSTISHNRAGLGGGIDVTGGTVSIVNSTISGNEAYNVPTLATWGGGISNFSWDPVVLINSTITDNTAAEGGDGIFNRGIVELSHTVIANNFPNSDCYDEYGTLTSMGNNLDSDGTCNLLQPTDLPGTNPVLGPLADNGGPTETHALLEGSPAIDAGSESCTDASGQLLAVDQRGEPRPVDGNNDAQVACDMGSYELQPAWMPIEIDIKPGNKKNVINPREKGGIWVAIVSETNAGSPFDPSSQVDIPTVEFGPDGANAVRHKVKDINKDGLGDLLLRFRVPDTGIACGDTEATLTGVTSDGQSFTGTDSVKTVGCK